MSQASDDQQCPSLSRVFFERTLANLAHLDMKTTTNTLTVYSVLQENVTAVLTSSPTDVLSHVAIRARSQGVLLATCFDDAALSSIKQLEGRHVQLAVDATGAVTATESAAPSAADSAVTKQGKTLCDCS